ncbi:Oxygen sensor histidine kinase NreB [Posidoniimonas polymericola]|uniref:Oxygen sensor histidine kinase NreB n=1 Tax=Posidoniimonas polymericola TaxID=2528002 RepID=A0A5C5YR56_9BACT|nr:response regulator [Posidoniimonas polymericola]TWT77424.1 Oxygen sensor histidine kinase NreB [Posidoniimonas polymericola]
MHEESGGDSIDLATTLADLNIAIAGSDYQTTSAVRGQLIDAGALSHRLLVCKSRPLGSRDCDIALLCVDSARQSEAHYWLDELADCDYPVVVLSDRVAADVISSSLGGTVDDYITWDENTPSLLRRGVLHAVDRHELRRDMRQQNERLLSVVNSTADGILVVNDQGAIRFANPAASAMLGLPADDLIGSPFGFPVVSGEHAELELRRPGGESLAAELRISSITWEHRGALLIALRDISERKRIAEQQRRHHERVRQLTNEISRSEERERRRLARVLHDDLQQLLVAARMSVSAASKSAEVEAIHRELEHTLELLEESVRVSRSLTSELTPTVLDDLGLGPALEWLCRLNKERYGLDVTLSGDLKIQAPSEDLRGFLFQAARELLFNAVKHAAGAPVTVDVSRLDHGHIRLEVRDRGPGFDPRTLDQVDLDAGGFGLFHMRQRIEHYDGCMQIESQPGSGARFIITAPIEAPSEASPADRERPEPSATTLRRVVLIDDSRAVRHMYSRLLGTEHGVEVVGAAATGLEGLRMVRELTPDVVLSDISLPDIDGRDLVARLRQEHPQVRVVGLSMHSREDVAASLLAAGAAAYARKDEPLETIVEAIMGR